MAVVNRGEKYDEKEVSNKWRWEWCTKLENEERVGDYIRKIDTPGHAKCILCPAVISYGNRGLPCLANHLKSKKHTSRKASVEGNSTITGASRGEATPDPAYGLEPQLRARMTAVTTEKLEPLTPVPDRVWNLEAMTLAFAAEKGLSLRTVPDLISFAQAASRDKPALEKLSMDRTTASYKLREGLAPYLQESFLEEVRGCYFSLNIDEATSKTNQKVLAVLICYFSPSANDTVVHHLDAISVTKVTARILLQELDQILTKHKLCWNRLVSILMDSCAVMRGSKAGLETLIREEKAPQLLDIDGDSCHHAHNSAKEFCKPFQHHIEQMMSDIHTEFKWSLHLRDLLFDICRILGLKASTPERYVPHRWLSVLDVAIDTVRLFDAYTVFYYSFLPNSDQSLYSEIFQEVMSKRGVSEKSKKKLTKIQAELKGKFSSFTKDGKDRKFRLVDRIFTNRLKTECILLVYTSALETLKKYVVFFQKKDPLVHLLHSKQEELFNEFCGNFLDPNCLQKRPKAVNIQEEKNHLKNMFMPQKVKDILASDGGKSLKNELEKQLRKAYVSCALSLQSKMPHDNPILKACSALDPHVRTSKTSLVYLKHLTERKLISTKDKRKPTNGKKEAKFVNDGSNAALLIGTDNTDAFIQEVQKFASDPNLKSKPTDLLPFWANMDVDVYPHLTRVAKAMLSSFHGPLIESSFSSMGDLLDGQSSRMDIATYAALQTVRYHLSAKKTSAVECFAKKDPVKEPVPKKLCTAMQKSWQANDKRKETNLQEETARRTSLGAAHQNPLTKTAEKRKITQDLEREKGLHGGFASSTPAAKQARLTCDTQTNLPSGEKEVLSAEKKATSKKGTSMPASQKAGIDTKNSATQEQSTVPTDFFSAQDCSPVTVPPKTVQRTLSSFFRK